MNWDDYRYFLSVARAGQLSPAGRLLGVDHATVGRRVNALEAALDSKLFDRSPKGYALTSAGEELVPLAEAMERHMLDAQETVGGLRDSISGPVRIGLPDGVCTTIGTQVATELCAAYPKLQVQLISTPGPLSLAKREADLMVSATRPRSGRLKVQKIADYKTHVYASQAYLEANPKIQTVSDFAQHRGIGYVPDMIFDKALDYIPLLNPNFSPHLTSTSLQVQLEATLNGAGMCFLQDFVAARHPSLVKILPDEISFERSFWYVVHADYAQLNRVRICAQTLIAKMREVLKGC